MANLGRYIVLEGLHRAGKTTQLKPLAAELERCGYSPYVCVRYKSPEEKAYRHELAKTTGRNYSEGAIASMSRVYVMEYERNQVRKRAQEGELVMQDRQKFFAIANGLVCGVTLAQAMEITAAVPNAYRTLYYRITPEESLRRGTLDGGSGKPDEPNKSDIVYIRELAKAYEFLASLFGFITIDGMKDKGSITKDAAAKVAEIMRAGK